MGCINGCMVKSNLVISLVPYASLMAETKQGLMLVSQPRISKVLFFAVQKALKKVEYWLNSVI